MPRRETRRLRVSGQVQGVGFRPFVYRLARRLGLDGEVANRCSHVEILLQGKARQLDAATAAIQGEGPGQIGSIVSETVSRPAMDGFRITASRADGGVSGALLTDRAICSNCRAEFSDPDNRRYGYPFIACTHCGPRFSIARCLPYDRDNTAWRDFAACADCQAECCDADDRRFHMVGISCPACGPKLYTATGNIGEAALNEAAAALAAGRIVAVKGSAGYQLMVDAGNGEAVQRLRQRKRRSKPFAVLAPALDWIANHATLSEVEAEVLQGESAPIVLLHSRDEMAERVAPGTNLLGVMLPNSAIQLGLLERSGLVLVATSGNLSESPLIYVNDEAEQELDQVADCILHHELQLTQGLDDSIVRVIADKPVNLRLGRGLAPQLHVLDTENGEQRLQGCGAQLKSNVSLLGRGWLVSGPHIGDLDSEAARRRYRWQKQNLPRFFQLDCTAEVTDLHPDYGSTIEADYRARTVPHHIAHAMAAWFEHREAIDSEFIALTWDGVGLGPDGTVWGGEFLHFDAQLNWRRVASVLPFPVPARPDLARLPRVVAQALTGEPAQGQTIACSSMGRLIEALAVLAGLEAANDYEARLAMTWEALATEALDMEADGGSAMDFDISAGLLDWRPLLPVIMDQTLPLASRALGFHRALACAAARLCRQQNVDTVLLSGGVFQNKLLSELLLAELTPLGIRALGHGRVPPNDGGISLGQCVAAAFDVQAQRDQQSHGEISKCA